METLGADIDSLVSSRKIGGNHDVRRYGFTPASGFWGLLTINRNGAHDQPERCSRWPGIGAHDRPELVLTMRRNTQNIKEHQNTFFDIGPKTNRIGANLRTHFRK